MKNVIALALGLSTLTLSTGCCWHHGHGGGACPPACGPAGGYYGPGSNLGGATTFPQGAFYSSPATTTTQANPTPATTIGATSQAPYYEDTAYQQQPTTYAPGAYTPTSYSQTALSPPMQALPTY